YQHYLIDRRDLYGYDPCRTDIYPYIFAGSNGNGDAPCPLWNDHCPKPVYRGLYASRGYLIVCGQRGGKGSDNQGDSPIIAISGGHGVGVDDLDLHSGTIALAAQGLWINRLRVEVNSQKPIGQGYSLYVQGFLCIVFRLFLYMPIRFKVAGPYSENTRISLNLHLKFNKDATITRDKGR